MKNNFRNGVMGNMESAQNGKPYVLIKVGPMGVECITLGAQTEGEEAQSLGLYIKFHHIVREIDQLISGLPKKDSRVI